MKIRLTIMTENDKHIPENKASKEKIEEMTKAGWDALFKMFASRSDDNENAYVESCELVER